MNAAGKIRPVWGDVLVALIILAAAVCSLLALSKPQGDELTALVMVDGEVVWSHSLERPTGPIRYEVEGEYSLTLEVSPKGVRVVEASCPGEDCRRTGIISKAGQQIVCLPNRMVVTISGDVPAYDAVTG